MSIIVINANKCQSIRTPHYLGFGGQEGDEWRGEFFVQVFYEVRVRLHEFHELHEALDGTQHNRSIGVRQAGYNALANAGYNKIQVFIYIFFIDFFFFFFLM